ncbi:MAG TPA: MaoC/PaaZ C-terminal domain-containing protein [Steroidobacteraceae bacterium]|nr:MaoC/PaaZ C-terminal domain-containing protein [Steroidobacteraceae bacterium]
MSRSIHLSYSRLPSGLASYPRVFFTSRPPVTVVTDPTEVHVRVPQVYIDAKKVARYAAVCGFAPGSPLPATYPHVLATPLQLKVFATRDFVLRPTGLIHLSNVIDTPGELRVGSHYDLEVIARNYRPTDAGLAFDMDSEFSSEGQVVWRETCVFLSRWPEPVERTGGRPSRPPRAPKDAEVLAEFDVPLGMAWRYARVSGDYNPIHLNQRLARSFGLRGAIIHGMWSLARSLAAAPECASLSGGRLTTQFLTPVLMPARVAVKQWMDEGTPRRALCDVRTGRVHMYAWWTGERAMPEASTPI